MSDLDIPRDVSDLIIPLLTKLADGNIEIVDTPGMYPQLDTLTLDKIGPSLFYAYVLRDFVIHGLAQGQSATSLIELYVNVYLDRPGMKARYHAGANGSDHYLPYQVYR